jgi:hypothetical protein
MVLQVLSRKHLRNRDIDGLTPGMFCTLCPVCVGVRDQVPHGHANATESFTALHRLLRSPSSVANKMTHDDPRSKVYCAVLDEGLYWYYYQQGCQRCRWLLGDVGSCA